MLKCSDQAVEVIGLPEGIQGAEAGWVDETARNAFSALERVGEGFAVAEGEERMAVIGHDDAAHEVVALAVEVMEAGGDNWGEAWITQGVGAVCGGEVFVELVGELAVAAGFGDVLPRRRIRGEEGLAGAKPVIKEFTRFPGGSTAITAPNFRSCQQGIQYRLLQFEILRHATVCCH